jgi:hypothetical protein
LHQLEAKQKCNTVRVDDRPILPAFGRRGTSVNGTPSIAVMDGGFGEVSMTMLDRNRNIHRVQIGECRGMLGMLAGSKIL